MKQILAIDFGDKYIGLAVGDTELKIAVPYTILTKKNDLELLKNIEDIIKQENIDVLLVGMPLSLVSNFYNEQREKTDDFIQKLKKYFPNKEVIIVDERLSSKQAQKLNSDHRGRKDAFAAQIILQSYLDSL